MFSSEIWRSVASNHYLELGQILSGAPINLLPGERVLRISITILLIFPCAEPLCVRERGVFMWTPQRKHSLQHTHTHLFMLADARWLRRLQNAHIGIFSRFSDLTCTSPKGLTYEHKLFNSESEFPFFHSLLVPQFHVCIVVIICYTRCFFFFFYCDQ